MKITIFTITFFLVGITTCLSQSIERSVVASSGDYYEAGNISLSWTLGEIATETHTSGNTILTQGFQQPDITLRIFVDLTAFLEGPFNETDMNSSLNSIGLVPLSQPYNTSPWNYPGIESVSSIPNSNVVDWLLIELRDAANAPSATSGTMISRKAAFILKDGSVVGMDGLSNLEFNCTINNQLYVVVWHRNHLGMMSAIPLIESGGIYTYNFTTAMGMAYLNGQKGLNGGVYGMYAGDADGNGAVNTADKSIWVDDTGKKGYKTADFNMNSQVSNQDKNDRWLGNINVLSKVPN